MQTQQPSIETERLGPLAHLVGSWEGEKGHDFSPSEQDSVETRYRETTSFEPVGPINNGSQALYGLRFSTYAWPYDGDEQPFHEELGYWLWSPKDRQVIRCLSKRNGIVINAGGQCDRDDAQHLEMSAQADDDVFGIASTPALNQGLKTVSYRFTLDMQDENHISYVEEMRLKNGSGDAEFIHKDENVLTRVF